MTYPATTYAEGVELTITSGNQLHEIINGDATEEINTESGMVPSVRKALADSMLFKPAIAWAEGSVESDPFQTRLYGEGIYWAPAASNETPISMGTNPNIDGNWFLAPVTGGETISRNTNLLSNHNFIIQSPDDITHPSVTPTDYVAGTQVFSGVFVGDDIVGITYINGRVSWTSGTLYFSVPNSGALEYVDQTDFVASVADFDGKPRTRGVSYALVGDEYRVTVGVDALEDESANETLLGSVKFEQGSVATGHEVAIGNKTKTFASIFTDSTYTQLSISGVNVGDTVVCEDYAPGNNSGVLLFKVVPAGTGVADGGKYIDVDANKQLEQNLRFPVNIKAYGAVQGGDLFGIITNINNSGYSPVVIDIGMTQSSKVELSSPLSILGVGLPIITSTNAGSGSGDSLFETLGPRLNLDGLAFDGDNNNHRIVEILDAPFSSVTNCQFNNTGLAAIDVDSIDETRHGGYVFKNLRFENISTQPSFDIGRGAMFVRNMKNAVIEGIYIKDCYAKGVTVSKSNNCSVKSCFIDGVYNEQAGLDFGKGENNYAEYVEIINTRNPVKISTDENGTIISKSKFVGSTINPGDYGNGVLIQGGSNCVIDHCTIDVTSQDGVRIEQHPEPEGSDAIDNTISNCKITLRGGGNIGIQAINNTGVTPTRVCEGIKILNTSINGEEAGSTSLITLNRVDRSFIDFCNLSGASSSSVTYVDCDASITNNTINHTGTSRAIFGQGGARDVPVVISRNKIDIINNAPYAIDAITSGRLSISLNTVAGDCSVYPIQARNSKRLQLTSNDIDDTTSAGYLVASSVTGGLVDGNISSVAGVNQGSAIDGVNYVG